MARGSGAGTGVIVSLVVSLVCNVGLLIITFMMYSGKTQALESEAKVKAEMSAFVAPGERDDAFDRVMDSAKESRKSLYSLLEDRRSGVASFVAGNGSAGVDEMRTTLGLDSDEIVKETLSSLRREMTSANNKVSSLSKQLETLQGENDQLRNQMAQAEVIADEKVAKVEQEFDGYRTAAVRYEQEVNEAINAIEASRSKLNRDHENRVNELQSQIDRMSQDNSIFRSQIEDLRKKTENYRIKPQSPAELVDGRVINVPGSGGQIFLNLGRKDRVVPGMTFEVYDDAAAIRPDPRTNEYVRGKASIEVIRVGADTATARITREIPGRPVVKDDVVANAVFNPEYRFKFLVHGKFDVDGDGTPSEAEADYVRRRIVDWGGELVEGDELTGDLDFLVLGVEPPEPLNLTPNSSDVELRAFLQLRESRDQYDRLFDQSTKAQIPVLNWNRFELLTGMNDR